MFIEHLKEEIKIGSGTESSRKLSQHCSLFLP